MTSAFRIREMSREELPAGLALSTQAGWNQTAGDWRRMHDLADSGCFAAEGATGLVGTAVALRFCDVAWLAMVLVEKSLRGLGIGTALVHRAIEHCDALGVASVRLDATPLGRPVYERLGFRADYEMIRLTGDGKQKTNGFEVSLAEPTDFDRIGALDRDACGCDRSRFLRKLFNEDPKSGLVLSDGDRLSGFVLSRAGRVARHVGPCIAVGPFAGSVLLEAALSIAQGPVQIDVPADNAGAMSWARERGLSPERTLLRMTRGRPVAERVELLWAGSGPEKG